jgi:hypothetical protein
MTLMRGEWRQPPEHCWSVNSDACYACGKSGLQLLQEGNPPCTQEARDAFALRRGFTDWREQWNASEAR